mmetsp:Transcript_74963/g.201140  ORF Transcript_74963/g.201140 Transcript_74963/m.201140 type:complete len:167 (+) Transcript_74963:119-619(+)
MQQAEISLPPLSVLLKEGLKGSKTAEGRRDIVQQNGSAVTAKDCHPTRDSLSVPLVKVKTDEVVKVRTSKDTMDVTLFPRRKAGENSHDGARGPVVLSVDLLKTYFGVPLHVAAKKLVRDTLLRHSPRILTSVCSSAGNLPNCHKESLPVRDFRLFAGATASDFVR